MKFKEFVNAKTCSLLACTLPAWGCATPETNPFIGPNRLEIKTDAVGPKKRQGYSNIIYSDGLATTNSQKRFVVEVCMEIDQMLSRGIIIGKQDGEPRVKYVNPKQLKSKLTKLIQEKLNLVLREKLTKRELSKLTLRGDPKLEPSKKAGHFSLTLSFTSKDLIIYVISEADAGSNFKPTAFAMQLKKDGWERAPRFGLRLD